MRMPAAQTLTICSGVAFRPRVKAPRSALPSMLTTPLMAKPLLNLRRTVSRPFGSSARRTLLNVSWLGIPCLSSRNRRNNSNRPWPKNSNSVQLLAPASVAASAMITMSSRSCRVLSARGSLSGRSRRLSLRIQVSLNRKTPQNPVPTALQHLSSAICDSPTPRGGGWVPCSAPRTHGPQHRFAWPAVDLEAGGFLIRAERRARLHAGHAVELVLVKADARQVTLHGLDIGRAQLRGGRPWRGERLRACHAVGEMADEQHIQVGEIIFLDDEVVLRGQEGRAVDALDLQQRGRLRLLDRTELLAPHRHKTCAQPFGDRFRHLGHAHGAIDIGGRFHLVGPAHTRLPTLVDELLRSRRERVRHRMPDIDPAVAVEIDAMLVVFGRQELRVPGGAGPGR